jgi:hypothetical protein
MHNLFGMARTARVTGREPLDFEAAGCRNISVTSGHVIDYGEPLAFGDDDERVALHLKGDVTNHLRLLASLE